MLVAVGFQIMTLRWCCCAQVDGEAGLFAASRFVCGPGEPPKLSSKLKRGVPDLTGAVLWSQLLWLHLACRSAVGDNVGDHSLHQAWSAA